MTGPHDHLTESLERRRFLAGVARLGGALAIGGGLAPVLAGCSESRPGPDAAPPSAEAGGAVPEPTATLVSRWGTDPWTRGGWSSLVPAGDPAAARLLAAPVADRLFFAGEATSADLPGTLGGAYRSGQRATDEVAARFAPGSRLVVIGAGLAGLAAARRWDDRLGLAATVLEGRDRVGGRMQTVEGWGGPPAELGAVFIDSDDPGLVGLADRFGLPHRDIRSDPHTLRADGGVVPSEVRRRIADPLGTLLEGLAAQVATAPPGTSLAVGLDRAWTAMLEGHPALDATALEVIDLYVALNLLIPRAASPDRLALAQPGAPGATGTDPSSGQTAVVGGNSRLPEALAQDMDVRLDRAASAVQWSSSGVVVQTAKGPIAADAAIVTVPIGVLQAGTPAFDPPLPADKQTALASLGPGRYEQCYLRFPRRFWGAAAEIQRASPVRGRWARFVDVSPNAAEHVLLGVNVGHDAESLDGLDDQEVADDALSALRSTYT